jgi:hypothetical protein
MDKWTDGYARFLELRKDERQVKAERYATGGLSAHQKYVYCFRCNQVMCMRQGARGCYTGHSSIVEIDRAMYEGMKPGGDPVVRR